MENESFMIWKNPTKYFFYLDKVRRRRCESYRKASDIVRSKVNSVAWRQSFFVYEERRIHYEIWSFTKWNADWML